MRYLLFTVLWMPRVLLGLDTLQYDLSKSWKQLDDKTVQLIISDQEGDLIITGKEPFSIFINHQLSYDEVKYFKRSIHSLFQVNSTPKQITINSKFDLTYLNAHIRAVKLITSYSRRQSSQNLTIIVCLFLSAILIVLWKTFPQTLTGYLNFSSILNFRTIEENLTNLRATSLNNLFVYLFISLLAATQILILSDGALDLLLLMEYTGLIISILLIKILWLNLLSKVFNIAGFAPHQFFSFSRMLMLFFVVSSILILIFFILTINLSKGFNVLTASIISVLLIHTVLISARLIVRGGFTAFHLFSYLCASEFIPTSILVKILSLT